jgi:hypothetical protein
MSEAMMTIVVTAILAATVVKLVRIKAQSRAAGGAMDARAADFSERMDRLERRMANLETIVLDAEKRKEFERQL